MKRKSMAVTIALIAALVVVLPAAAVQFGQPDGDGHPQVGLLVFDVDGGPAYRCSGTMIAPRVLLTAGHCTFDDDTVGTGSNVTGGRVWFEPDVGAGFPANGYPSGGGTSIAFESWHTHPNYDNNAFFLHDVGVVILAEDGPGPYASVADVGLLDDLSTRRGQQDQSFTVVGYGLQSVVPELQADLVRHLGEVSLIDVNGVFGIPKGTSASFTNNPGKGNGEGGTCFGDSGGPVFHGDSLTIAAITSFGVNANCAGTGGGYRVDTADDQAFINSFLP
ncbi:MAG: S1 family peptidase [Anaerolineales bacterium]